MKPLNLSGLIRASLAVVMMFTFASGAAAQSSGGFWSDLGVEFSGGESSQAAEIVGDTYVLPSSGVEVVIGPGVESTDPAGSDVEDQIIVSADGGLGAVAALPAIGLPIDTLEAYVGGFAESMDSVEELDLQESKEVAAGVYRVETAGTTQYLVISVNAELSPGNHVIEAVVTPAQSVESLFETLSSNISIEGVPMLTGLDKEHMLEVITTDDGV